MLRDDFVVRRPTPVIPMIASGMPPSWRPIIEAELTAAQVPLRALLEHRRHRSMARLRRKIWLRLVNEINAVPHQIATRFGYDHTSVYYALGRLTNKPCEYA